MGSIYTNPNRRQFTLTVGGPELNETLDWTANVIMVDNQSTTQYIHLLDVDRYIPPQTFSAILPVGGISVARAKYEGPPLVPVGAPVPGQQSKILFLAGDLRASPGGVHSAQIDTNPGDIQPLGRSALAGTTLLAADAGHRHAGRNVYPAADYMDGGGAVDDTANAQALLDLVTNRAGIGGGVGSIFLPENFTPKITTPLTIVTGQLEVFGAGRMASTFKTSAPGPLFDIFTSGPHYFHDFGVDGMAALVGSPAAIRMNSGMAWNTFERLDLFGFPISYAMILLGVLDNLFYDLRFHDNNAHLLMQDSAVYPSNENTFRTCKFYQATQVGGVPIEIVNAEGNRFEDPLIQGNAVSLYAMRITSAAVRTGAASRFNKISGGWFEGNGHGQAGSRNIVIGGGNLGAQLIQGTRIENCDFLNDVSDDPAGHINLSNCDSTFLRRNFSNLNTVKGINQGAGVTRIFADNNAFANLGDSGAVLAYYAASGVLTVAAGVGNDTTGHNHGHTHGSHGHSHTHGSHSHPGSTAGAAVLGGPAIPTITTNDHNHVEAGAGATPTADATTTTPAADSTGESSPHTHTG